MSQRKSEWLHLSEGAWKYHRNQFKEPYRSTIKFIDWLEGFGLFKEKNQKILDVGCGCGANIYYIKNRFPEITANGIDINNELVEQGNAFFERKGINDCKLISDNLFELKSPLLTEDYTGVISFQTFLGLPEYEKPIEEIAKLNPSWIALSSLFFDGPVNCKIEIEYLEEKLEDNLNRKAFYNIYSISQIKQFFEKKGYKRFEYSPFEIDIDLKKPMEKGMGSYTETLVDGRRLLISGPLLMSWYFIVAIKDEDI